MTVSSNEPGHSLTISHIFGELVWLMTQSSRHSALPIAELAWTLMPAIANRQFHLFHEGERPVGAAIWGMLDDLNEQKLLEGKFHPPQAGASDWISGDRCWLIDLIAPFADDTNKQAEVMLGDLVSGVFRGKPFGMLYVDPITGERRPVLMASDVGERLADYLSGASS